MTAVRVARPEALPAAAERLCVVEASAGTGKTFFLEHRVVDLILGAGAELGQILLVTFTDKAVAELRLRIRDLLDRLSRATSDTAAPDTPCWVIDDAGRAALRAAVTAFDRAPIFTIHGYCHRVLVEDAFAARRLFDQAQVADDVAFEAAFDALLRERFARSEPERELLRAYLASGESVDDLRDLLLRCARANAPSRRPYDAGAATALAGRLRTELAPARRPALLAQLAGRYAPQYLAELWPIVDAQPADGGPADDLAFLDSVRALLLKLAKYADPAPAFAALIGDIIAGPTLAEAIAAAMLPALVARVTADKAERGQFDYDDMLRLVRDALAGSRGAELAARLRARTPWVMIDEFQDTDATQWQIFRDVWMHADARGLTIVGDPKQAIYGFRGADVHTYLTARDELRRAGAATVALDVNRRSTPELVAAVNQILVGTLGGPLLSGDIAYDAPVRASGDVRADGERAPVTILRLADGKKEKVYAALADAIGAEVESLRATRPRWERRGVEMPFSLADVMILTRSHKDSAQVARALRRRGLPCSLVESDKLFETREAAELADVLDAIAAPRDRSARLRALRTRFFDVPWGELARVVDAPDHHPQIARLFDWAALAARRTYETLFRRLVEDSRYAERALVAGGGERAITNTWHLVELLLGEVARARCAVHELAGRLRRWLAGDDTERLDELDVQRVETDAEAVRVLTVHKAKGLEAPYVFLFGGTSAPPPTRVYTLRDAGSRALVVDPPKDSALRGRLDADTVGEHERLAYVALTRAQVRLYLPWYDGEKICKERSMYHRIQACLGVSRHVPGFETVDVVVGADEAAPAPADALAGFAAPAAPELRDPAPIEGVRGGLALLSYTRLANDVDVQASIPHGRRGGDGVLGGAAGAASAIDASEFDRDDDAAATTAEPAAEIGRDELPRGAASGLLLHHVLEHADLALARAAASAEVWAADPDVAAHLEDGAREHGVDRRYAAHAARLAYAALTQPLALTDGSSLPPLVEATAIAREVEFAFPMPVGMSGGPVGGLVKGFIDVLVAWNDELWVLDYKSDLLGGADLAAAARARVDERYAVQARLYAIAADRVRGTRRLAGLLFAFVRHGQVVPVRVGDETLAGWTRWLGALPLVLRAAEARP